MLNSIQELLSSTSQTETITNSDVLMSMGVALVLGIIIGVTYLASNKDRYDRKSFAITLVMLPVILGVIILFVGSNVARAFSLAGTLSIIRFRSAPGDAKDIGYIFFSTAVGVGCGVGMYAGCLIFTVIMSVVMLALEHLKFGSATAKKLKITIPEDLNYEDAFSDVFEKMTSEAKLLRLKTTDLGSLYEAVYRVKVREDISDKELIDELRTRNGNLNISMTMEER